MTEGPYLESQDLQMSNHENTNAGAGAASAEQCSETKTFSFFIKPPVARRQHTATYIVFIVCVSSSLIETHASIPTVRCPFSTPVGRSCDGYGSGCGWSLATIFLYILLYEAPLPLCCPSHSD